MHVTLKLIDGWCSGNLPVRIFSHVLGGLPKHLTRSELRDWLEVNELSNKKGGHTHRALRFFTDNVFSSKNNHDQSQSQSGSVSPKR